MGIRWILMVLGRGDDLGGGLMRNGIYGLRSISCRMGRVFNLSRFFELLISISFLPPHFLSQYRNVGSGNGSP